MRIICNPTHDGNWIAVDLETGEQVSGRNEAEARREIERRKAAAERKAA